MFRDQRQALGLAAIAAALLIAALTVLHASAHAASSAARQYTPLTVKTPDGLTVRAQVWGNPSGPEILFIHGFSQSYLSWIKQTGSDLPKAFRMVTYDLRGHGGSDKPSDAKFYQDDKAARARDAVLRAGRDGKADSLRKALQLIVHCPENQLA